MFSLPPKWRRFVPPKWRQVLVSLWRQFLISRWRRVLIWGGLVFAGLFAVTLGYEHVKFRLMLDERLQKQPHTDAVYFRPFTVRVGQTLAMKTLLQEINASGYRTAPSKFQADWYESVPGE